MEVKKNTYISKILTPNSTQIKKLNYRKMKKPALPVKKKVTKKPIEVIEVTTYDVVEMIRSIISLQIQLGVNKVTKAEIKSFSTCQKEKFEAIFEETKNHLTEHGFPRLKQIPSYSFHLQRKMLSGKIRSYYDLTCSIASSENNKLGTVK